jgi:hypothetical protein
MEGQPLVRGGEAPLRSNELLPILIPRDQALPDTQGQLKFRS